MFFLNVQYYHIFDPSPHLFFPICNCTCYCDICSQKYHNTHTHVEETAVHARVLPNYEAFRTGFLCHKFHEHEIITLMYIYHVPINTLSTHMIRINLDTIFHIPYTCRAQSYQNSLCKVLYPAQDYAKAKASFFMLRPAIANTCWSCHLK